MMYFHVWVSILSTLSLGFLVTADPPMSIDLSILQWSILSGRRESYTYTIDFDVEAFNQFQSCLCNPAADPCNVDLSWYDSLKYNAGSVTNDEMDSEKRPLLYVSECSLRFTLTGYLDSIECNKITEDDMSGSSKSGYVFSLLSYNTVCTTCNSVQWLESWKVQVADIFWNSSVVNVYQGFCVSSTSPSTTQKTTSSTSENASSHKNIQNDDSSDDSTSLVIGIVVALVVVILILVILVVIFWRKKRSSKPPTQSHQYTTSTEAISQNYEDADEVQGHVNGHVATVANTYVTSDDESMTATRHQQQNGRTMVDSYVSPEEVIHTGVDEGVPHTPVSPDNGAYNTHSNNGGSPDSSSATPSSTAYSRLGEPVRTIQNPYNALQNPDEYSVAISTPGNSNTSTQYSLAGPATSPSSTQDSETVHSSTPLSQLTNRNAYGYEEVGVNNMTAPVVSNDYEESPTYYASGDNKDGAEAPKEPDYTNFPVKEPVAAKNDYAKLGEPVRNIQNLYDVMVNQKKDGPEESMSQAPPNSADDPYSLARPNLR